MNSLDQIDIILCRPSHTGNIGAAARAMKNMGLSNLKLVAPRSAPDGEAIARASGADDILDNAKIYDTLDEALADRELVFGTSARSRHLPWTLLAPKEAAEKAIENAEQKMAIVFGNERTGLTNEELTKCHYHVNIPTVSSFSSLNLGAAVQVICYELYGAYLNAQSRPPKSPRQLATGEQMASFYQHWQDIMIRLGFLDRTHPKLLMRRIRRIFNRAELDQREINILRGFLSAVDKDEP